MSVVFAIRDLGRNKWNGEICVQVDHREHIEAALLTVAKKHLLSRDIDFDGDVDCGKFIVGGFRAVGQYRRKAEERS